MKSELVLFDIVDGSEQVLLAIDRHIEAPNWHPDGSCLIVNGGGRLYSVDIAKPELEVIDTGFAVRCNNDHGISPDGTMLVISDGTQNGQSAIYTLPVSGGVPKPVTSHTPSYWHGWSPDGRTLAYVGKRTEGFDVYTISVDGGEERCLIDGFDHCDGPDYTPDGEWIWFNGERESEVDLWRMRTDGSDLQKMSDDEFVNWFPHPSPDGKSVLYLAFPPGTKGHPANLHVSLCMVPAAGGEPQILTTLLGGQGTINVPCWAPDSRRFAFMRYGLI